MEYHKNREYKPEDCPRPDKQPLKKHDARVAAARLRHVEHRPVGAYLCGAEGKGCGAWHLGKSRKSLVKLIRRELKPTPRRKQNTRKRRKGKR